MRDLNSESLDTRRVLARLATLALPTSIASKISFFLVRVKKSPSLPNGTTTLLFARELGAKALSIWESMAFCSASRDDLFTSYVNQGACYTNLAKYHYYNIRGLYDCLVFIFGFDVTRIVLLTWRWIARARNIDLLLIGFYLNVGTLVTPETDSC